MTRTQKGAEKWAYCEGHRAGRVLQILPAPAHAGSCQGTRRAAAGAPDQRHRPRINPATLPQIYARAPAKGGLKNESKEAKAAPQNEAVTL